MKGNILLRVGILGVFAAALLASCYAPLRNQNASLSLSVKATAPSLGGNQAVLLLIDSNYQSSLAQLLSLISQGHQGFSPDAGQIKSIAKQIVTNGLVNFNGNPFYLLNLSGSSGPISIPGIPAGHSYLAKLFVFNPGYSFDPDNIDAHFFDNVAYENIVFSNNGSTSGAESYNTPLTAWTVPADQLLTVESGETASVSITLTSSIP